MDMKTLIELRPKDQTADAIRVALGATGEALAAARTRVREHETARPALMLTGGAAEMQKAETSLTESRAEAERLSALADALRTKLAEAEAAEARAEADALAATARAAHADWLQWVQTQYTPLATRMVAGLRLELAAADALRTAHRHALDTGTPTDLPPDPSSALGEHWNRPGGFGGFIALANLADPDNGMWGWR